MIDLNVKFKPEKSESVDFSIPVPEGTYACKVLEVKPWVSKVMAKIVNKKTGETLTNVTVYNATVILEIVEGAHKGRRLFYNLTTHPNMPWIIPNFLFAANLGECTLMELQSKSVGRMLNANVKIEEREITREDKETGIPVTKKELVNSVKSVRELEELPVSTLDNEYDV